MLCHELFRLPRLEWGRLSVDIRQHRFGLTLRVAAHDQRETFPGIPPFTLVRKRTAGG
jgi:hypothetical protein